MYDARFLAEKKEGIRRGCAALVSLLKAYDAIDAVDDLRLGYADPADDKRVTAAREVLAAALREHLPSVRHALDLAATAAGGPDTEGACVYLTAAVAALAPLAVAGERATKRAGKQPPRARRAEAVRIYRARWAAEREGRAA